MVWKIIKDTIKYSFYGFSLLAISFFAAMLMNVVQYHPLWGTLDSIEYYVSGIVLAGLGLAIVSQLLAPDTHYQTPLSAR